MESLKRGFFASFACVICLMSGCSSSGHEEKSVGGYKFGAKVAKTTRFLPLRPGAVQPKGWIKDWAEKAAHGITGHLDQRATTFAKGWSGESFEARGVNEEGTNWPLEQSAYWLDGLVRLAYILDDSGLKKKVKARLDPIVDGVLNGGPSFIYWRPKEQLKHGFDNWAHSHMGRAMVAYYLATGDQKILDALVKVYRNYPLPDLPTDFNAVSGAVNVDPMLETYLLSGDSTILDSLRSYAKRAELKKTVDQWADGDLKPGHSVIYYEDIRVPALLYALSGSSKFLNATQTAFDWGKRENGLPIGLVSGEEYSAGIGSTRNVETCDVAAGAWTNNWLLRITGNGKYGDNLETIFFNAGPAPIDKNFNTMCYYQSPNRLSSDFPEDEPMHPGKNSFLFTKIGHPVLCCVGNSNRIIPNYIMHMWMKPIAETGIAATLYGPSVLKTNIAQVSVTIKSQTAYPFRDNIEMAVDPEDDVKFKLFLRIPEWSKNPVISLNGNKVPVKMDKKRFATINRTWSKEDKLTIKFPRTVKILRGKTTNYPDIKYFKNKEARRIARTSSTVFPYASVKYGPLLFAYPIPDAGPNKVKKKVPYNYALAIDPEEITDEIKISQSNMPESWEWSLEKAPLKLSVPALQFGWKPKAIQPLPVSTIKDGKRVHISLVPYGNTKFRVSMFPVSSRTWNGL